MPASVADAVAVFDADTIGLADGTAITTWTASIGSIAATGQLAKPVLKTNILNGRDVVRNAHPNQYMTLPSALTSGLNGTDGGTVIYVGKINAVTEAALFGDFGTDAQQNHYPYSDNTVYEDFLSTVRKTCGNFNTQLTAHHIGALRSKTNLWNLRLAEVSRFNTTTNTFGAGSSPRLFHMNGSGTYASADLAWWALFDRYLSDAEVIEWETYLGDPAMFNL